MPAPTPKMCVPSPRPSRRAPLCAAAVALAHVLGSASARADGAVSPPERPPLNCAVEAAPVHARALDGLCTKLGRELGREVRTVADVRRRGDGVQVIETELTWYVVMLEGGHVRAFTRISAEEARGREVAFVARAVRALATAAPSAAAPCLRIDPLNARTGSDVVYPWAELVPCTRTVLDVRDPWWVPVTSR